MLKLLSCIRAPPDAHTIIRGKSLSVAYSINRVIFSPTTDPILPPINSKSIIPMLQEEVYEVSSFFGGNP